jgi:ABC-type lipoprotein export system ATPase subunit
MIVEIPRNQATEAVVSATDVMRRYGEGDASVDALRGVSVDIPSGQFTAVMGPSGSGKSSLMHILAGLDRPTLGSVTIAGDEITSMGDKELTLLRRRRIGFIFQFFNLLPMLTAKENIVLPMSIAGRPARMSDSASSSTTSLATLRSSCSCFARARGMTRRDRDSASMCCGSPSSIA